ncbi:MAG TPA: ribbon-helix-helix domain-containing protein [Acetobacteraceae bacterium]|nr:ribbon-helix-helix domain-containing protein [Acetobacteraceae bacterium]
MSGLVKRSFALSGHRTSVALEPEFWSALVTIAGEREEPLSALVQRVDAARQPGRPLASALRVLALQRFYTSCAPALSGC